MKYTCDLCGGENPNQEYVVLLPMNGQDGWEEGIANSYALDFYRCPDCDEECSPIASHINSLHPDYVPD